MTKTKTNNQKKIEELEKRVAELESKAAIYDTALDWVGVANYFWKLASNVANVNKENRERK